MSVEFHELEAVLALADELHYTRAARRLRINQPALSRKIDRLERRLGVRLFDRSTRVVTPTPAGAELAQRARQLIKHLDEAVVATRARGRSITGELTVGFIGHVGGEARRATIETFTRRHPEARVRLRGFDLRDLSSGLTTYETDIAFVWQPLPAEGIEQEVLFEEGRVLVVPSSHPLAAAASVSPDDVTDPVLDLAGAESEPATRCWSDFWHLQPAEGPRRPIGATVATVEEWFGAVLQGAGVGSEVASAATYYPWPGLAYVPLRDVEPARVALAWRADSPTLLVDEFRLAARAACAQGSVEPPASVPAAVT